MGGKKKTKWRKLPLEEFTKEIPSKQEKVPCEDTYQADLKSEDNNHIPSYNETSEFAQQHMEQYEYSDGFWYPTPCAIYNPAEVALYPNYMMPIDTCYYYYTVPDVPQMQDYGPMPHHEYTSQLPKDTVYLLLPTQALRSSQPVQSTAPEWYSRRPRRRYEGYADYAVIPEKTVSNKADCSTRQHVNSRRNSYQSNNLRKMTSFPEPNNFHSSEKTHGVTKPSEGKKLNDKGPNEINNTENNQKLKKNLEMCGIHTKTATDKNEPQTMTEKAPSLNPEEDVCTTDTMDKQKTFSGELVNISTLSQGCDSDCSLPNRYSSLENGNTDKKLSHKTDDINKEVSGSIFSLQNINQDVNISLKPEGITQQLSVDISAGNMPETNSQSSLPDILSTINKTTDSDLSSSRPDSADLDKGRSPKSKSCYLPNFLSSEALHNEMELELKQLKSLHSLQANQSIYKLAYDENLTDQSEADSRSPSPIDPESQVPTSLTSAEILIHEADSGSDAGSEDVELLPHRYESETFLNESKHMYVNKLSLAVELLRTQESLPYDDEFKRVVGENNLLPGVHSGGKVNMGFVEDSCSPNDFSITNHFENKTQVVSQCQLKHSANSSSDSAIFSDTGFDNLEDELCEAAKEAVPPNSEIQDNTEEIRAGYRRFGIQARNYFSPRAALSLNPCFCCIVM